MGFHRVWIALAISCLWPFSSRATESVDPRVAAFASAGFADTIAVCKLPTACAGKSPHSSRSAPVRETGNDNIVEEHVVSFDGLDISFIYVLGNASASSVANWKKGDPYPPPHITHLKITSAIWPIRHGLRIGTSRVVVERALGRFVLDDDGCSRVVDEKTEGQVVLCFVKNRLSVVEWTPWWDG
jgi:hypothetical protein